MATIASHHDQSPLQLPQSAREGAWEDLVAALAEEMTQEWRSGRRPCVEHFLDRHPQLRSEPAAILDLLYDEICMRCEYNRSIDRDNLIGRFPAWPQQIDRLIQCVFALEGAPVPSLPRAGETLAEFRLLHELGRGCNGCVFLATQSTLGDRPVVLKVTSCRGDEHLSLARLQHTHIVPLLSIHDHPEQGLHILCMPYFGGLTLEEILTALAEQPWAGRTGRQVLKVLDDAEAQSPVSIPGTRTFVATFLDRAGYVQAMVWMGACLADALKYAHQRGLVHLDLKPSNVLLTADRQPMLFDFHLAREPVPAGDPGMRFGGTPTYMSPEQRKALAAIKRGKVVPDAIDGRSDIYSLGLILYESLGGPVKTKPLFRTPLHRCNPQVSIGLSDIIAKCLSPDPRNRYLDAGQLAEDLAAHLCNLPLIGVPNRSVGERWRKWRRRRPFLSLLGMLPGP